MEVLKFYTPQCVHCPTVSNFLEINDIEHTPINLFEEPEKSIEYKIKGVPTIVIVDENKKEIAKYTGSSMPDIRNFLEENGIIKGE